MKFGKALETNAETMPEEWRPYLIQYKSLKKKINAIVKELDDRGLPSPIIKDLLSQSMSGDMHRLEYSFDEDKEHLKTCIKVVIGPGTIGASAFGPPPATQEGHLSKFFAHELAFLNSSASSSSSDLHEGLDRAPNDSAEDPLDDVTANSEAPENSSVSDENSAGVKGEADDHMSAANNSIATTAGTVENSSAPKMKDRPHGPISGTSLADVLSPLSQPPIQAGDIQDNPHEQPTSAPSSPVPTAEPPLPSSASTSPGPSSPSSTVASEAISMETLITPGAMHGRTTHNQPHVGRSRILTTEEDGKKVLVIELTADTAFFDQLGEEVSQLSKLQQANKQEFESKVEDLSKILTVVSSPQNKDMYTWREILKVYLDAQVFVGGNEADRSTRSSEKAQQQLQWFLTEMDRSKLVQKFKQSKSKIAFNAFFQLNSELITMKQFRELNQMAMTKILKKHDKRTNLTASSGFPKHLQNEPFYTDNISKSLTYTIGNQLVSIIPQPDDYSCPICMSVAWKPIRLRCKHVFCVRCLIKAQRKRMINCPVCRQTNSVLEADASNLDVSMMNFMEMYFPKEIKEKRKESGREQAKEEMEAFTGQRWSEVPDTTCILM
ncbi:SPX domain-containing protein [Gamsiella multidivaricata]|uniref:SPX domain-containing protein n=1 Tax=Gamsiella multidivaricata TaxID=101098 RepID=UPI00221F40A2|nr:SPX domain-containing protein [Gamsiella multidivaricata]KAG0365723.1 hypothetical protein BGZ54_006281 [Gamsiella multidivaricata]KAI7819499.1 SPX domain-containing protein [Gamsiella multidivaricata]